MLEVLQLAVLNGHKVLEQRIFLQTCTQKLAYLHMSWTLHVCLYFNYPPMAYPI